MKKIGLRDAEAMAESYIAQINMSRIPVAGAGGLGMVAAAGAIAYLLPEARAFTVASLFGGLLLGFALIAMRSGRGLGGSRGPTLPLQGAPAGSRAEPDGVWRPTTSDRSRPNRMRPSPLMS